MGEVPANNDYESFSEALKSNNFEVALEIIETANPGPLNESSPLRELGEAYFKSPDRGPGSDFETRLATRVDNIWRFYEENTHAYQYPRKLMKYAVNLVVAEGGSPEAIERALKYFEECELFDEWLFRSEAEMALAKVVDPLAAEKIRLTVFNRTQELLAKVSDGEVVVFDEKGYPLPSYTSLDNILSVLAELAKLSSSIDLRSRYKGMIESPALEKLFKNFEGYKKLTPEDKAARLQRFRGYWLRQLQA